MNEYHVEHTPEGVSIMRLNDDEIYEHVDTVPYSQALERLNNGEWDDDLNLSFMIATSWIDGVDEDEYTDHDLALLYRFVISFHFYFYCRDKNGVVEVEGDHDDECCECALYFGEHGGINIYPSSIRFMLTLHVEETLMEEFGEEIGISKIIDFYGDMRSTKGGLTDNALEKLSNLLDIFIKHMNENGIPEEPIIH